MDNIDLSSYAKSSETNLILQTFDGDLSTLDDSLSELNDDLVKVNNDLTILNEDLYDAEGHLKVTEEDLNATKQSLTNLSSALTILRTDLNSAEASLDDLEADLQTTSSSLTTALSDLETLETQLNSAKDRITTAEGNITSANQSISNHQTAITNLNDELDGAKDRITATENSLTTANQSISNHQSSITNLNGELDSAKSRLTTTETNIRSLRTSLNSLSGDLTILADMLTGFTGTIQEFDAELVRQGIDKTELNEDIYNLVSQICRVRQVISDTDQKIDDTVTDINALDTSVVPNLKNKIDEAKASGDTAQQDLATAKTDINNLNSTTFPNLKNKIDEAKNEGLTAQSQLQETKEDLEDLNKTTFPSLVGAIEDAQASGDTAQSNLTTAITEINNVTAQGGTFANLHNSINNAQSAADDAQDNLDTSIADIENLTGTVFPNLKNHIETARDDIDDIIDPQTGSLTIAQQNISQVQTDIGDVNQSVDGSLQEQITYLPSYIDRIYVSHSSTYSDTGGISRLVQPTSANVIVHFSELAKKVARDNNGLLFTVYVTDPDNITNPTNIWLLSSNIGSSEVISVNFSKLGQYVISCEHLKYNLQVGKPLWNTTENYVKSITTHNAEDYSSSYGLSLELHGDVAIFQGMGKTTTSISANGSSHIVTVYPPPNRTVFATWTGNNKQGYIIIGTDGVVTLYNRNGTATMSSGEYFIFNCSYMI